MLVLSRKPGERILIGNDIVVTVVRFQGGTVRLGIEAPREFSVVREELTNGNDLPSHELPSRELPSHEPPARGQLPPETSPTA
jgi:carbon storage regulator